MQFSSKGPVSNSHPAMWKCGLPGEAVAQERNVPAPQKRSVGGENG